MNWNRNERYWALDEISKDQFTGEQIMILNNVDETKNGSVQRDFLTRHEAAEHLRVSVRSIDQKASDGKIPYYKLGNRATSRVVFKLRDLKKYIEKCRVEL